MIAWGRLRLRALLAAPLMAAGTPAGMPVSYTHLDVYKRQEDEFGFGESREGERQHKQKGPQHRSEGGEKKTAERVRRHGMSAC